MRQKVAPAKKQPPRNGLRKVVLHRPVEPAGNTGHSTQTKTAPEETV